MCRVFTEATMENLGDIYEVESGRGSESSLRRVSVEDAVVDTMSRFLLLPTLVIEQLGLSRVTSFGTASGCNTNEGVYEPVRLTIQGRTCTMDVFEAPPGMPVLIGHIPLVHLDLVIDFATRELTGNPAHGGEHMYEMY